MAYEELFKDLQSTATVGPIIALDLQPRYAMVAAIVTLLLGSFALVVLYSNEGNKLSLSKISKYTLLSGLASVFFALATIFTSNSFGVYV
ncbi:dolichyl-diphosphooligosaccharide--protein glycotransferase subunit KNAG_0B00420 [Huiozyma naganishii CBS 8797]|uniref:Dolichyl-diphosphooligosaccharide-protein glycosyltransferase subunit OST5 n=1 Tax=Huiozyma naganishii (strain ATCC MYA-139 / BCRC 22969 / CBS 8797 / KCTC 17520 / NBRC 10181 / NCYC 3082 / Yp74L-3) TaxID=1071383 RepID=J7S4D4_HUIN7|nr:hypothetical protein KNAG_0B00420 [Kazachstania naganishii CBS 8797]CCK68491.1 hypothetical protein KNAG_0B00420 [Kazachstania naganishii CBS 8797]